MQQSIIKKTTLAVILLFLISAQISLPYSVSASSVLDYNNFTRQPNNAYRVTPQNTLNSGLLMAVVGCTGIVNKLSTATAKLINKGSTLVVGKAASKTGLGLSYVPTGDEKARDQLKEDARREECFNGLAYTLAKMQLTAMTKATMNWVNTGLNGNPLYVQDQSSFINRLTDSITQRESQWFAYDTNLYPYGRGYSRSLLDGQKLSQNFQQSMQSSLLNYIADGGTTQTYSNDFSQGGWNGWLGLTQNPENNPLGFTMKASQQLADDKARASADKVAEINRNQGYLDQRRCVATKKQQNTATNAPQELKDAQQAYDIALKTYNDAFDAYAKDIKNGQKHQAANDARKALDKAEADLNKAQANYNQNYTNNSDGSVDSNCTQWETVTPGSTIKDKISTYTNSPERQLEIADTINESLNALFTALIARFQDQGLSSLGTTSAKFTSGSTDLSSSTSGANSGFSGSVDITRDLGGIIKTQKEYVKAATEALVVVPQVTPKVGELDYCIPGPNPNWAENSEPTREAYLNYINGIEIQTITEEGFFRSLLSSLTLGISSKFRHKGDGLAIPPDPSEYQTFFSVNKWSILQTKPFWTDFSSDNLSSDAKTGASAKAQANLETAQKGWTDFIDAATKVFTDTYNKLYGPTGLMQTEIINTAGNISDNPAYLPMAQAGLSITKNLKTIADDTAQSVLEYKDNISQTNGNIYKLNQIKTEVDAIVKAAQARRAAERAKAGLPPIPAKCLAAELGQ